MFAVGDVRSGSVKRVGAAIGEAVMAEMPGQRIALHVPPLEESPIIGVPADGQSLQQPSAKPSSKLAVSFVGHAKLIGVLTLLSRILGLARESVSARWFGAGAVSSAFTVAFKVPNLFRKLLGEGALSVAFIPLYAQALKSQNKVEASRFAAASVNLLGMILLGLTIVGEARWRGDPRALPS